MRKTDANQPIAIFTGEFKISEDDDRDWRQRMARLEDLLMLNARTWVNENGTSELHSYSVGVFAPKPDMTSMVAAVYVYDVGRKPNKEEIMRVYAADRFFDYGEIDI